MSYEIVKSITKRKKDDVILITSASNNVCPRHYTTWEFMKNADKETRDLQLFYHIIGNNFQLSNSVNKNWTYADNKFRKYCKENNIDIYELWDLPYKTGKKDLKTLKPYYEIFKGYLEENHKGKFYLSSNLGYISKLKKDGIVYIPYDRDTNIDKCCKNYKAVYNDYCRFTQDIIEKYNLKIEKHLLKNEITNEEKERTVESEFSL